MSNLLFTSEKNYMKRAPSSGIYSMLGPNVVQTFSYYTRDKVIPHGVSNVIPMFRLFYEPFSDGKIWEAFQDTQNYLTNPLNNYGGTQDGPTALSWVDPTNVNIRLYFPDASLAGTTFPLYLVVYEDYGAA